MWNEQTARTPTEEDGGATDTVPSSPMVNLARAIDERSIHQDRIRDIVADDRGVVDQVGNVADGYCCGIGFGGDREAADRRGCRL